MTMRPSRTRREFLRLSAASAVALGLAACGGQPSAPAATATAAAATTTARPIRTLKVGHLARQLGNLVPQYDAVGLARGVKFEVSLFPDGAALLQALSTGDVLLAAPTKVQLVQSIARGVDVAMVCGYAGGYITFLTGKSLQVTPGDWAGVRTLAASRKAGGKPLRIGVPTASLQYVSTLERLKAAGIDAEKDVEVVNVPFNEHVNALAAGQIDMAGALALFAAQGLVADTVRLFQHAKDTPLGHFEVGFITSRKLARERPEDLQDIVSAHYDAMKNIVDDPTHGLAREVAYTQLPEAVVKRSYEFLTFDWRVDVDAIRRTERVMRDLKLHTDDLSAKIDAAVDLSFLAKASGKNVADVGKW
jgi:NitT/TauT family transport system substrate-binding protein